MLLTSTRTRKIFDKHSFWLETQDVVDAIYIDSLFGYEAVIHAIRNYSEKENTFIMRKLDNNNSWFYLTWKGFCQAISYCNEQDLILADRIWAEKKQNQQQGTYDKKVILLRTPAKGEGNQETN